MGQRVLGSIAGVGLALALGGCGATSHRSTTLAGAAASPPAATASPPAATAVIRSWAQALARGDIGGAAAYFASPSSVQFSPGTPAVTLRTPAQLRLVNLMLPCGAKLLDTRPVEGYIDALFLLSTRPGGDCGRGVGGTARVAFVIRAGKIAVWRRIADEQGDAARASPGHPPPVSPDQLPPTARSV